jgi:glycosyltransferase involved in cell wall biosynthesis
VVITTKNSAKTLGTCLKSIRSQTYGDIEINVIDNYSIDRTGEVAEDHGVRALYKGPERSVQRNYGAKRSKGDFLLFVDADMELTSKVVEQCVAKCENGDYGAVIIPEITVGEGFWAEVRRLERTTYFGDTLFEAARFFRRNVFEKLDGYDEKITGSEDYDLQARLEKSGYGITHIYASIIHHEGQLSLRSHLMKKYYYAKGSKTYLRKHPYRAMKQFIPVRRSYFKQWRLLLKTPLHGMGLIMLKVCELSVGVLALIQ